jgi:hypothetical protein
LNFNWVLIVHAVALSLFEEGLPLWECSDTLRSSLLNDEDLEKNNFGFLQLSVGLDEKSSRI